jgi:hypothetical protein
MTLRFGKWFELACSMRGVFLKLPGMGHLWVGKDELIWDRRTPRH